MVTIDLNADLGEGTGTDAQMMACVTSASIACGGHTGDRGSMMAAAELAGRHGVVVGAHPSFPDREGFGRRPLNLPLNDLGRSLRAQVADLAAVAPVRFLKAHGALYNSAAADRSLAEVVIGVAHEFGLVVLCPAGSQTAAEAEAAGVPWKAEGFADRAYLADGTLAPRSLRGAVVEDPQEAAAAAVALATTGRAPALGGGWIDVRADSICVHGDTPGAVAMARAVREALAAAGVEIHAFA